ncbi:HECT-domain-containing protein [Mycena sanguinolenta]|uniref:HECT-type E3 ubiquitin transferase n=1 Tax=Mycena sanguinolenta TaxID=230812 RepID=A0A8H7CL43_9AGAR|nr:HECT-domain-containing protein [Mycena sanguinolenta]
MNVYEVRSCSLISFADHQYTYILNLDSSWDTTNIVMLPLFRDEKRREINLGGTSSVFTRSQIIDQAHAARIERAEHKLQRAAICIQSWWRGVAAVCAAKADMRKAFETDIEGLLGLRCMVLIGMDQVLGKWSQTIVAKGEGALFAPAVEPHQSSWCVLIRQIFLLLLRSIAASPKSPDAVAHLKIMNMLVSADVMTRNLGPHGRDVVADILMYVLKRNFYPLLSEAIRSMPTTEAKLSTSLPLLVPLATVAFSTFTPADNTYAESLVGLVSSILTIPLLPNRLPLPSLTQLSSHLPLASFPLLVFCPNSTSITDRIHLVANLMVFAPPRYAVLSAPALTAYLDLLARLFDSLPPHTFEESSVRAQGAAKGASAEEADSDDESQPNIFVLSSSATSAPSAAFPVLDALDDWRTLKRLSTLVTTTHITSLLTATQKHPDATRRALFCMFLALEGVWPRKTNTVLDAVVSSGGGTSIIKELWCSFVGRADASSILREFKSPVAEPDASIPALLFLADLYAHALRTMSDDEFFGTSSLASAPRNPLSLDELRLFSRLLLDVASGLHQAHVDANGDTNMSGTMGPSRVRYTWEKVVEKVTKCLVAIHARDSRRSFTPPDHWLVSGSQIELRSFVDAALIEGQQIPSGNTRTVTTRQITRLAPRLGMLCNIPFSVPFPMRVQVLRSFISTNIMARRNEPRTRIAIRREHIVQDGFDHLTQVDLKGRIEITFIDKFGAEEYVYQFDSFLSLPLFLACLTVAIYLYRAGIDCGGISKEFFMLLCKEVFNTDRGLWLANKKNELFPNPHAYAVEAHSLNWYRFMGRIIGKAMYEGILVDIAFAEFFLAKLLGKQSFPDDLASLDPELHNNLISVMHYTGNLEDLSLNFTVAVEDFGVTKTVDLVPHGNEIAVTKKNRLQYIHMLSHYRLSKQIKQQSRAFLEGLSEIIDYKWLKMFNQQELQILIGGPADSPVNLDDLQSNTRYDGIFQSSHATIISFWRVVHSFDQEQRRALLRFVTSRSRPPLLGFKELMPNFTIRDAGSDERRLPTSSTCANLLKLPSYQSEKVLRAKLLQAIKANVGFDLS